MVYLRTIKNPFTIEGVGIHTGKKSVLSVKPSESGNRAFIVDGVRIGANVRNVVDTRRSTTLGIDGKTVSTVEHILAALYLAGIDSCDIEVEGVEIPILDGAAKIWLEEIKSAGVEELSALKPAPIIIKEPMFITYEGAEFVLLNGDDKKLKAYYSISIADTFIDAMIAGGEVFAPDVIEQMVIARTYGLEREVKALIEAGLALGGSLENAVIIGQDKYINDDVKPNEPAWHKLLDLMGDLSLTERAICGEIIAIKGGHRSHVKLAEKLACL